MPKGRAIRLAQKYGPRQYIGYSAETYYTSSGRVAQLYPRYGVSLSSPTVIRRNTADIF
jgi:hypothetical protein